MEELKLKSNHTPLKGPLLFVILDGVGIYRGSSEGYPGNALDIAKAPFLKELLANAPLRTTLKAHGTAVGLPDDGDMGNSEVGHNAMGAGRIFAQGARLIGDAIQNGRIFESQAWMKLVGDAAHPGAAQADDHALHLIGLLSDGNVHSHIDHLFALIDRAKADGVKKLFVHALLDGRDVEKVSAHRYIQMLEEKLKSVDPDGKNYRIASGGGRMQITMDRYEADWDMVQRGWLTHVKGEGRFFSSAMDAVETLRRENPDIIDQDLPPFVIARENRPVGVIREGDAVILFNYRGDRAIEISRAFTEESFQKFIRDPDIKTHFAGIMEYDGDLHIPPDYLVEPPLIERNLSRYLAEGRVTQYAISETQKYGHVTYFWNGNNSSPCDPSLETWVEIPSDRISFDKTPRMKADEITDALILALNENRYRFLRVNYPNGDMVGHTGDLNASVKAVEAVDENIGRLLEAAKKTGATLIITADHGNCEQMLEVDNKGNLKKNPDGLPIAKTSHTLSPVPFILCGAEAQRYEIDPDVKEPGLANLAATILFLLGFEKPNDYLPSIIKMR